MPSNDFSGLQAARANLLKIASQAPEREVSKIPGMLAGYAKDYEAKARQEKLDALAADERAYQRDMDAKQDAITKEKLGWLREEQGRKRQEWEDADAQKEALSKYRFDPLSAVADQAELGGQKLLEEYERRGGTGVAKDDVFSDEEARKYGGIIESLQPTQEQAQQAITRDLLNIYNDPIKAATAAKALASDYSSRASIQAAEDKQTKQVTDALKQQVQQNKDMQDQKQKTYDNLTKRVKTMATLYDSDQKAYKSTNKKNYFDAKKWVKEANVSPIFAVAFSDEDAALKVLDYAESQDIPAGAALKVLQNKFQGTPGGAYFGDEKFRLTEARKELEAMAKNSKKSSSYKRQLASLLPEPPSALPASALTYQTPVSRTVEEVQYDQGIGRLEKLLGKSTKSTSSKVPAAGGSTTGSGKVTETSTKTTANLLDPNKFPKGGDLQVLKDPTVTGNKYLEDMKLLSNTDTGNPYQELLKSTEALKPPEGVTEGGKEATATAPTYREKKFKEIDTKYGDKFSTAKTMAQAKVMNSPEYKADLVKSIGDYYKLKNIPGQKVPEWVAKAEKEYEALTGEKAARNSEKFWNDFEVVTTGLTGVGAGVSRLPKTGKTLKAAKDTMLKDGKDMLDFYNRVGTKGKAALDAKINPPKNIVSDRILSLPKRTEAEQVLDAAKKAAEQKTQVLRAQGNVESVFKSAENISGKPMKQMSDLLAEVTRLQESVKTPQNLEKLRQLQQLLTYL
jgi:hypothetical protein